MTMPSTVAVTEMMSASATIMRRTCFVLAPTARISASSRRRWLIVMPNTLLMMNALTNVVMKANASRPLPKIEMNELMSSAASSATCWPVTTSVRGGRMSSIAALTVAGSAPSASFDVDRVVRVAGAEHLPCGLRVEHRERGAAEAVGVAEADQPDDRERFGAGVEHDVDVVTDLVVVFARRWPCRSPPHRARRVPRRPSGRRRRCHWVRSTRRRARVRLASGSGRRPCRASARSG